MKDNEHAHMMLNMARRDLKALEGMKDPEIFVVEIFGFHAQQAVEKALKAWLSAAGAAYPKIHDLEELFALLKDHGATVPAEYLALLDLTDFAIQFRYDSYADCEDEIDRHELILKVTALLNHVETLLPIKK
jgi:HEPN domain-containing protein